MKKANVLLKWANVKILLSWICSYSGLIWRIVLILTPSQSLFFELFVHLATEISLNATSFKVSLTSSVERIWGMQRSTAANVFSSSFPRRHLNSIIHLVAAYDRFIMVDHSGVFIRSSHEVIRNHETQWIPHGYPIQLFVIWVVPLEIGRSADILIWTILSTFHRYHSEERGDTGVYENIWRLYR